MRQRAVTAAVLISLLGGPLAGCSDDDAHGSGASARPVYDVSPRTVRPEETGVHRRTGKSSDLAFNVIGFTAGMRELVGSHADMRPKYGQYVRVRVVCENRGRDTQYFATPKQLLLTTDGKTYKPAYGPMLIKRQPAEETPIGASMRVEMDLWFDVPAAAKVRGVRLFGSPAVGAVSDPPGADITLP